MQVNVNKNTIYIDDAYIMNNGEYNVTTLNFNFSEEYNDENLIKKAIFKDDENEYEVVIFNNQCDVPYEILSEKSEFTLKVYAYEVENDELVVRYSPTPLKIFIREGSYESSSEVITPSQFEQYEAQLNEGLVEVNRIDIDANKEGTVTTVTIAKKDGTTKTVEILDGEKGEKGDKGDKGDPGDIANLVWGNISGTIANQIDLANALATIEGEAGVSASISLDSSTYVMTLQLKNKDNVVLSSSQIDLPLETMVVNASYDSATKEIVLTLKNGNTIRFSVADLVSGLQAEITSTNKLASDLVDDTNQTNKFVTANEKTAWNNKYDKPLTGIPSSDLSSGVQNSLSLADSAIQDVSGKQDTLVSGSNIKTINNESILGSGDITISGGGSNANAYALYFSSFSASSAELEKYADILEEIRQKIENNDTNFSIYVKRSAIYCNYFYTSSSTSGNLKTYVFSAPQGETTASATGAIVKVTNYSNNGFRIETTNITLSMEYDTVNQKFTNIYGSAGTNVGASVLAITTNTYQRNFVPTDNGHPANKKYVDDAIRSNIAGYDATKTQVLKNINGTLTWVDE